eukprot:Nitzschia sp. Nitz4//scaffold192_size41448//16520//17806//NITZ4_007484-RA/size41448-processed-gene-0.27-mRNA-1//-1//CDS//3329540233//8380//frame0
MVNAETDSSASRGSCLLDHPNPPEIKCRKKPHTDLDDTTTAFVGIQRPEVSLEPGVTLAEALHVVAHASKTIHRLDQSEELKRLTDSSTLTKPLELHHSDIVLGDLLGQGSFSDVYAITSAKMREFGDPNDYVVKVLRVTMVEDVHMFSACAAGLATETSILSKLNHPNIVKLKARSHKGVFAYSSGRADAYFIVMDKLDKMLTDRLEEWRRQSTAMRYILRKRGPRRLHLDQERADVGRALAQGVAYLHEHRIVHRDLKPSNIGFQMGNLKIFDFDISRILPDGPIGENQLFSLTPLIGTRRYMSPECGLSLPYNQKADVYSFALILYEIFSLQMPYPYLSKREQEVLVFRHHERPQFPAGFHPTIEAIVQKAWSPKVHERPNMSTICYQLGELDLESEFNLSKKPWLRRIPTATRQRQHPVSATAA